MVKKWPYEDNYGGIKSIVVQPSKLKLVLVWQKNDDTQHFSKFYIFRKFRINEGIWAKLTECKMEKISEFSKFPNFRKIKLVGFKLVLTSHKRIFEICLIDTLKAYFHLRKFFCHVKINSIIFNYFKLKNLFY